MIKHVLSIKLANPSEENIEKTVSLFESMRDNVPCVRDIEVGKDFLHSERSFDICLIVTLDSREALDEYQRDAYHVNVVKTHVHSVAEKSVAVDFDI
jgi:hypothetical protein